MVASGAQHAASINGPCSLLELESSELESSPQSSGLAPLDSLLLALTPPRSRLQRRIHSRGDDDPVNAAESAARATRGGSHLVLRTNRRTRAQLRAADSKLITHRDAEGSAGARANA